MDRQTHGQYVGEVRTFAGAGLPDGWLPCDGQTLSADQYPELYAVIGVRYGGGADGTFCLPDLRARAVMGNGLGSGPSSALTLRQLGDKVGSPAITLEARHLPRHKHRVYGQGGEQTQSTHDITGAREHWPLLASPDQSSPTPPGVTLARRPLLLGETAPVGGGGEAGAEPHENRQPFLGLCFCIAWKDPEQ